MSNESDIMIIHINMNFEDSRNALFPEPNAYIQKFEKNDCNPPKKIVFQEPYENVPNFYIDNNFKKSDKNTACEPHDHHEKNMQNSLPFSFNLGSILPMLTGLLGKGGSGMSDIISLLGSGTTEKNGNSGFDLSKLMTMFSGGGQGLGSLLNLLGGKNSKKDKNKLKDMKSSDFPIKDYKKIN